jgi:hypothetical protein
MTLKKSPLGPRYPGRCGTASACDGESTCTGQARVSCYLSHGEPTRLASARSMCNSTAFWGPASGQRRGVKRVGSQWPPLPGPRRSEAYWEAYLGFRLPVVKGRMSCIIRAWQERSEILRFWTSDEIGADGLLPTVPGGFALPDMVHAWLYCCREGDKRSGQPDWLWLVEDG